ncbi:hypothetical protein [Oceanibium sediminis]|uniref:hypothetical protein n=1 Tax=Oceanibium sediminis TaxID=2026339 RepID=UPI0013006061|nr:hypothetical protein [Oceanibium sediminis]
MTSALTTRIANIALSVLLATSVAANADSAARKADRGAAVAGPVILAVDLPAGSMSRKLTRDALNDQGAVNIAVLCTGSVGRLAARGRPDPAGECG